MKKRKAFTLLEMILSMAFIALVFFPLLELTFSNLRASHETDMSFLATNLAQSQLETLRGTNFDLVLSSSKQSLTGQSFSQQITVTSEATGLKKVNVTIYWTTGGREQNIGITTYITSGEGG